MNTQPNNWRQYLPFAVLAVMTIAAGIFGYFQLHGRTSHVTTAVSPAPLATPQPKGNAAPPKAYITGLMSRTGSPDVSLLTYGGKPLITGFVIPVNWKDVQPNGPTDFNTTAIDSQLAFARQHSLPVRLRLYSGYNSPDWVLRQSGSVTWQATANDPGPKLYQVPEFWKPTFQQLYTDFDRKIATQYDGDPNVREVVSGMCITNFTEPFIRQFSVPTNVSTARANGYTDDLNNACLRNTVDSFKADWSTANMAISLNPYQSINASLADTVAEPTIISQYCLSTLASRCIIGNDSMKDVSRGKDYDALYAMMTSLSAPIFIQTASDKKIANWQQALQNAVDVHALSIELPTGYMAFDRTQLQAFNDKMATNFARIR